MGCKCHFLIFAVAPYSTHLFLKGCRSCFVETNEHQNNSYFDIFSNQVQVGGKKNSVILQKLTPDTPYSITVAAVYRTGESKDIFRPRKNK